MNHPLIFICSPRRFAQIFDLTEAVGFSRLDIPLGCQPLRGDVETNTRNARRYCRFAITHRANRISPDAKLQNGIPFAPHLLFTQFLNDDDPIERRVGLCLGVEMLKRCDELWTFGQPTEGMAQEIQEAKRLGTRIRRFDASCQEVAGDE